MGEIAAEWNAGDRCLRSDSGAGDTAARRRCPETSFRQAGLQCGAPSARGQRSLPEKIRLGPDRTFETISKLGQGRTRGRLSSLVTSVVRPSAEVTPATASAAVVKHGHSCSNAIGRTLRSRELRVRVKIT